MWSVTLGGQAGGCFTLGGCPAIGRVPGGWAVSAAEPETCSEAAEWTREVAGDVETISEDPEAGQPEDVVAEDASVIGEAEAK